MTGNDCGNEEWLQGKRTTIPYRFSVQSRSGTPRRGAGWPRIFRRLVGQPTGWRRTTPLVNSTRLIATWPTPRTARRRHGKPPAEACRAGSPYPADSIEGKSDGNRRCRPTGATRTPSASAIGTLNSRLILALGCAAKARNSMRCSPCDKVHEPSGCCSSTTTFCKAGAKLCTVNCNCQAPQTGVARQMISGCRLARVSHNLQSRRRSASRSSMSSFGPRARGSRERRHMIRAALRPARIAEAKTAASARRDEKVARIREWRPMAGSGDPALQAVTRELWGGVS